MIPFNVNPFGGSDRRTGELELKRLKALQEEPTAELTAPLEPLKDYGTRQMSLGEATALPDKGLEKLKAGDFDSALRWLKIGAGLKARE